MAANTKLQTCGEKQHKEKRRTFSLTRLLSDDSLMGNNVQEVLKQKHREAWTSHRVVFSIGLEHFNCFLILA